MASKAGDVSSRDILNSKLSSGLDALAGFCDDEKLHDNRDFNCLVQPLSACSTSCCSANCPAAPAARLGRRDARHVARAHAFRSARLPNLAPNSTSRPRPPSSLLIIFVLTRCRHAALVTPEPHAPACRRVCRLQPEPRCRSPCRRRPTPVQGRPAVAFWINCHPSRRTHNPVLHRLHPRLACMRRLPRGIIRYQHRGAGRRGCSGRRSGARSCRRRELA
jgi:hypothetical protein